MENKIRKYTKKGTGENGYKVGDYVKQLSGSLRVSGIVKEIYVDEDRNIFQCKVESGRCCHPNHEYVVVRDTKPDLINIPLYGI